MTHGMTEKVNTNLTKALDLKEREKKVCLLHLTLLKDENHFAVESKVAFISAK